MKHSWQLKPKIDPKLSRHRKMQSTPSRSYFFLSDPESLFIFGSSRSLRGLCTRHFFVKTLLNFGCIDGSQSFNGSRSLKM